MKNILMLSAVFCCTSVPMASLAASLNSPSPLSPERSSRLLAQNQADSTTYIRGLIEDAHRKGQKVVNIPAGTYTIFKPLPLYSNMTLRGAGSHKTILKNSGANGPKIMFSTQIAGVETPKNIKITNIGFDSNGFNREDFLAVIAITGQSVKAQASNIRIQNNRFYDSVFDRVNPTDLDCDIGLVSCSKNVKQRQYILVLNVDGLWVTDNQLSGGGRIKVGRPGRNIYVQRNTLNFVNDNAITFVNNGNNCRLSSQHCFTENVYVTDNVINNPVNNGIFFGADGEKFDHPDMRISNVVIARNKISGFFGKGIFAILPPQTNGIQISSNQIIATRERAVPNEPHLQTLGLMLKSGPLTSGNAQNVVIRNNVIMAANQYGLLRTAALSVGNITNLKVVNNKIYSKFPGIISRGFQVSSEVENAIFRGNVVVNATHGFSIRGSAIQTHFIDNKLMRSQDPNSGQLRFELEPTERVQANLFNNQFLDGQGYGISCHGNGQINLSLRGKIFKGNLRGENLNCRF